MRNFGESIHLDYILPHMKVISEKQAFQVLSKEAAARSGLPEKDVYKRLVERTRSGRSGIGDGVAIPHLRFRRISKPCIIFARLDKPIPYETLDDQPVDLICMLLSPDSDGPLNLQRLALITRVLRNPIVQSRLREAQDADAIKAALLQYGDLMKAA